ncbi:prepilin-type N-terminal cleavage/methylation domain-containing protein [Sporosarcina sp. 179-K 8C2 HS]|uniref:prepilin-type N-terminal cleavage/methylation domain-containing protein n=1 Tax=Sporosarcina sp. 179-K 8C2 HS TaxID=3142387 RepID=UPI0039A3DF17
MIKRQKGMTLVEVLVTLVLVSLVITLIWTTVFFSIKYNNVETKKLSWQREANRIITEIQKYHRQCDAYELMVSRQKIQINNCIVNGVDKGGEQIANDFYYAMYVDTDLAIEEIKIYPIISKGINASYSIKLTVRDPAKKNPNVTIDSKITRYQPD